MGYWLMLVMAVVFGGMGTIRLGVPLLSMACIGIWPVLSLGWFILMAIVYVVFIEWWMRDIHPSMKVDEDLK